MQCVYSAATGWCIGCCLLGHVMLTNLHTLACNRSACLQVVCSPVIGLCCHGFILVPPDVPLQEAAAAAAHRNKGGRQPGRDQAVSRGVSVSCLQSGAALHACNAQLRGFFIAGILPR
jgi:hypothetical protein